MAHCTCISFKRSINDKLFDNAMITLYHDWDHHPRFLYINSSYGYSFKLFVFPKTDEKSMISIAWMRPFSFFISRLLKIYLSFFIPWKKFTVTQTSIFRRVVERTTGIGLFLLSKQQQRSTMFFFIKKNSIR